MNDINELYRPLYLESDNPDLRARFAEEINHYQQISLTRDDQSIGVYGFDIPAMWGHYGDKGNGVCIVFERKKLIDHLVNTPCVYYEKVTYRHPDDFNSSIFVKKDKIDCHFTDNEIKEIFFKKTIDWSYEQEFRILIRSDSSQRQKLNVADSVVAIIICNDFKTIGSEESIFGSETFNTLTKYVDPNLIFAYGSLINQRFLIDKNGNEIWCSADRTDWDFDTECNLPSI